jgi:surfactin synthase thioesterase subunit
MRQCHAEYSSARGSAYNWLHKAKGCPVVSQRLVYFPFAGGDETPAYKIADYVPMDTEVWAASLPGSGRCFTQGECPSIAECAVSICTAITKLEPVPTVLWGHSMGGIVAFETARAIESVDYPPPCGLVVSATLAPQHFAIRERRMSQWNRLRLLRYLDSLGGLPAAVLEIPELVDIAIERFRRDIALCEHYEYRPGFRLSGAIFALAGSADMAVPPTETLAWSEHSDHFHSAILPGGHFFAMSQLESLAGIFRMLLHRGSPRYLSEV